MTKPTPGKRRGTGKPVIRPVVTITTDFGSGSPYVAALKGVVLGRCSDAVLIDVSHEVPAFDVVAGAFVLYAGTRHFPAGTVHLAVVDPGVGTSRMRVAVQAGNQFYVGPDNGLLWLAVHELGLVSAVSIPRPPDASATFEGRDVFAPAAAAIACGSSLSSLGRPLANLTALDMSPRVLWVDAFGNLVTNVKPPARPIRVHEHIVAAVAPTYGDAMPREPFVYVGSMGYLEIGVREDNAERVLGARAGMPVEVL
jgi:S-adenosyl-L-methionine hydrolase (adenosine-forming)